MRPKPTAMIGAARIAVDRVKSPTPSAAARRTFQDAQRHSKDAWRRFQRRAPVRSKDAATAAPIHPTPRKAEKVPFILILYRAADSFVDPKVGSNIPFRVAVLTGLGARPKLAAIRRLARWESIGWRFGLRSFVLRFCSGRTRLSHSTRTARSTSFNTRRGRRRMVCRRAFGPSRNLPTISVARHGSGSLCFRRRDV